MTLTENDSFAIFRFPNEDQPKALVGTWNKITIDEIGKKDGFILSDFNKENIFILEGVISSEIPKKLSINKTLSFEGENKEKYLQKCEQFTEECKSDSTIEKVVLSRIYSKKVSINIIEFYKKLNQNYKNTFNCILNHPEFGTWIVATPEVLLKGKSNEYTTVALAGTMKNSENEDWKEKESVEQQFVTDYLLNQINQIGKVQKDKVKFETIEAGKVKHRKTTVPFQSTKSIGSIVDLLHPTPAVAGTPKDKAIDFILNNEGYNRKLYTGFLGYNTKEQIDLFVHLRCAEISDNQINVYIGGGLTKDSIPEKEWEETILKSKTLLQFL